MKKVLLLAIMFAATVCNAQVVLWNGDDKELGSDGGFWNRADPTVVEEDGNKCLKVTLKANPGGWDKEHCNAALPLGDVDFKGLRRMTLRMKMGVAHNVLVKLVKEGDGGYSTGRLFWLGNTNDWNILTFEFGAGPDNDKITDTGNTVLEIWPFEDGGDALNNVGQTIYIDDIKVEGPMVNGMGVRTVADNSLTGDVVVTGVIGKGSYQNTWSGDWHPETYDDYALLAAKLSANAETLDVRGAGRWDEDWDVIRAKCPDIKIILSDDDVTGIEAIENNKSDKDVYYNLAGQRVLKPSKGLYIVNGRKIMLK
ncbi:MAG: hypothetical protein II562_03810 [Prevotella sp.]|nr:hypothetical protein [Prevotella sp.]